MLTLTNSNGTVETIIDENQIGEMINKGVEELLNKIAEITGGPNPEYVTWEQYKKINDLLWDATMKIKDLLFATLSFDEAEKAFDPVWEQYKEISTMVFRLVKVGA